MADIVFPGQQPVGNLGLSNLPGNYDLTIYQGDYFEFTVTFKDSNGAAIPIDTNVPRAQIRPNYNSSDAVELVCTIVNNNTVHLLLENDDSSQLEPGSYIWDFQLTNGVRTKTYITGDVTVVGEVTR